MINFGPVPAGSVLPVYFSTYGKTNGESITLTGLAVTDIEIYKGISITQRASDAGYALIDTDGIDVDGVTGIHAFSIDTGDNTDAGFYAAGSFYTVVVSAVTIDSQTVNFIAATFRIVAAENTAGTPVADVTRINNVATTSVTTVAAVIGTTSAPTITSGRVNADVTHIATAAVSTSTAQLGVNVVNINAQTATAAAGVTFPSSIASPTNITAATGVVLSGVTHTGAVIPTVTTVTNQLTAAQIATGVWQDATAGDFTVASSIGKSLYTGNVAPGGANGLLIAGSNAATTFATLTSTGAFSINGTSNVAQTGDSYARIGANGASLTAVALTGTQTFNNTGTWTGNVTGSIGSLGATAKTDVNAEVVDALATDTYAEPGQGAPAATTTLAAKINYLYKAWRNKKTQTSSTWSLFADDATTVDQKSAVSDDGTTATRGEIATGP